MTSINRRDFLKETSLLAGAAAALSTPAIVRAATVDKKVRIGIIGCNSRGMAHIDGYLTLPAAEITWVCDVDKRAIQKGLAAVSKKQQRKPRGTQDLRELLRADDVDAVSIATPDHWHAPATILACAAAKHVYVEKPGSHNARESELMVAAARKHKRVVQMGNQRRSWRWVQEAIQRLHDGEIGNVHFARGWYANKRGSIGHGKPAPIPEWLDYALWQGPAPERPYKDNILHYNWHWFWNWGTGEIGNNGVHMLDLARWGLQVNLPKRITAGGNRYFYDDDWETPDTCAATFDFDKKGIIWEGHSCAPRGFENNTVGVSFYGDKGMMVLGGSNAVSYDLNNKVLHTIEGNQKGLFQHDAVHFQNFLEGILEQKPLRSEITEGQKSTMLCHLANIAWRSGYALDFDPEKSRLLTGNVAPGLWAREYRQGWEPQI